MRPFTTRWAINMSSMEGNRVGGSLLESKSSIELKLLISYGEWAVSDSTPTLFGWRFRHWSSFHSFSDDGRVVRVYRVRTVVTAEFSLIALIEVYKGLGVILV